MANKGKPRVRQGLGAADYRRLASFRYALRRFLSFSEEAAVRVGMTGQQYQAMLVVRASPHHPPVTINDLARQLIIRHNSAVGLVNRLVEQKLLARDVVQGDRRKVRLRLTLRGEQVLSRLASVHRAELRRIGPVMYRALGQLTD
jgi:DNA-binding MarR family transcriptional regulator